MKNRLAAGLVATFACSIVACLYACSQVVGWPLSFSNFGLCVFTGCIFGGVAAAGAFAGIKLAPRRHHGWIFGASFVVMPVLGAYSFFEFCAWISSV